MSEDTIAIAAAVSHGDGESGGAACSCCPRHRGAPPCSAGPLPALHASTRQLAEHHAGHAIHHACLAVNHVDIEFVTSLSGAPKGDVQPATAQPLVGWTPGLRCSHADRRGRGATLLAGRRRSHSTKYVLVPSIPTRLRGGRWTPQPPPL